MGCSTKQLAWTLQKCQRYEKIETDGIRMNCSRLKETKQIKQPKTIWEPQLNTGAKRKKSYKRFWRESWRELNLG